MKNTRFKSVSKTLFTITLLIAWATIFHAQNQTQWKTGDKVEILNLSKEWVPGTVIGTVDWDGRTLFRVQLDDPNASTVYFNHTPPSDMRARGGGQAVANQPENKQPTADAPQISRVVGTFNVGDRVDTFYDQNRGHNRGTVIEAGDRKYKVHYNGCTKTFDEWVDSSLVREAATITPDAPEIEFLIGKWRTTTVAVGGNYAVWGSSPGIQINFDGTYIWFQPDRKPPVKGTWATDAKVPGLVEGTPKFDGIIVKDGDGAEWKVFKWVVKTDRQDRIEINRMCLGLSEVGTRVR